MTREQRLERVFDLARRKRTIEKEISDLKNEAQKYNSAWAAFAVGKKIKRKEILVEHVNEELDPLLE